LPSSLSTVERGEKRGQVDEREVWLPSKKITRLAVVSLFLLAFLLAGVLYTARAPVDSQH
jgi:hypothetical protein